MKNNSNSTRKSVNKSKNLSKKKKWFIQSQTKVAKDEKGYAGHTVK